MIDQRRADEYASKGDDIYRTHLKATLEPRYSGQYVAIDIDTGDYFLGSTPEEAITGAQKLKPDRFLHVRRVGYPAVYGVSSGAGEFPDDEDNGSV